MFTVVWNCSHKIKVETNQRWSIVTGDGNWEASLFSILLSLNFILYSTFFNRNYVNIYPKICSDFFEGLFETLLLKLQSLLQRILTLTLAWISLCLQGYCRISMIIWIIQDTWVIPVINAILQYFAISYQTLFPLPNTGRFKFVSIHKQSYLTLSSLPNKVGLSMYLYTHTKLSNSIPSTEQGRSKHVFIHTHKVIKNYPLYRTLVALSLNLSTHKAIKLYPLYRTMVGLSLNLSTHKAIKLYPLYPTR